MGKMLISSCGAIGAFVISCLLGAQSLSYEPFFYLSILANLVGCNLLYYGFIGVFKTSNRNIFYLNIFQLAIIILIGAILFFIMMHLSNRIMIDLINFYIYLAVSILLILIAYKRKLDLIHSETKP